MTAVCTMSEAKRIGLERVRKMRADLCVPLASREWHALQKNMKVVVVLMAGFDDGHERKAWPEFTPPEQDAIKLTMREIKRAVAPLTALTGW